jgi:acyl carrier protein
MLVCAGRSVAPADRAPISRRTAGRIRRVTRTSDRMGMTGKSVSTVPQREDIVATLVLYVLSQHPSKYTERTLPRDRSLLELGVIDSAGVVEMLVFVEAAWGIEIAEQDLTAARIDSLDGLAALVQDYVARKR